MQTEREQIIQALKTLGIDEENTAIEIKEISINRYEIEKNGEYFGIYDIQRNTFVD